MLLFISRSDSLLTATDPRFNPHIQINMASPIVRGCRFSVQHFGTLLIDLVVAERFLYPLGIAALPSTLNAMYLGAKITKLDKSIPKLDKSITELDTKLDKLVEKLDGIQVNVSQLYLLKSSKSLMSEKMLVRNGPCGQTQ